MKNFHALSTLLIALLLATIGTSRAQNAGNVDPAFDPGAGPSYPIYSLAVQTDGKIVIGGAFFYLNGYTVNGFARLNVDGSLDYSFNPVNGANGPIYAVALQADGKVLIGGAFNSINGYYRSGLARLNTDGSVDTTFGYYNGANAAVRAIAVQPDGQILVGGEFSAFNDYDYSGLVRLNSYDGSIDSSFDPGLAATAPVYAIALQNDGNVLVGGNFIYFDGYTVNGLVRLYPDGFVDTTFGGVNPAFANYFVSALLVQPDGKVIVGGGFTEIAGYYLNAIARLNGDGTLDTSFYDPAGGPNGPVLTLGLQSNGTVVLGGDFTGVDALDSGSIARLLPNGVLDTSYGPGFPANGAVISLALLANGETVAGGAFTSIGGLGRDFIARLYQDPTVNPTNVRYIRLLSLNGKAFDANTRVNLTAEVNSPNDPVTSLSLYNNDALVTQFSLTNAQIATVHAQAAKRTKDAPFQQAFADILASLASGLNNLKVVGTTQSGAALTSNTSSVTAKSAAQSATCQITNPASGPMPGAGTLVQVAVQKAAQPVMVEFYVDSAKGASSQVQPGDQTTSSFTLPTLSSDRAHYLTAVVTDIASGVSSQSVQVILTPGTAPTAAPVVSVVIPGDGGKVATISDHGPALKLRVTRAAADGNAANLGVSQPLVVNYKAKGSAQAGENYKPLSGSVTIPAGATSVKLKVKPFDADNSTTLKIKLLPSASGTYTVGTPVTKVHIEND